MSGLCFTVILSNFGVVGAADQTLDEKQMIYNENKENLSAAKDYAVALAQAEQFSASLDIFKQLYQKYPDNKEVLFDYIVVLNWSGNNRAAISLFEKLEGETIPEYVKTSVAGAYYQNGDYQVAQKLFHEAAIKGDHKAQIWEAQSFIRMGDNEAGNKEYNRLLEKNPGDIEVYLSRASMLALTSQHALAIADFEKAMSLVPEGDAGRDERRRIQYEMAISSIRSGDQARAIVILKPYIQDGTATVWMQGDYISALRLNADYKTAIVEGERLWKDFGKVPIFGLQSLGDSYVRDGEIQKAVKIYEHILKRDPNSISVKLGLAYSYMAQGHVEKGRKLYQEALKADPKLAAILLDDAYDFVAKNRYAAGKAIYGLVVEQFPNVVEFRQEMAASFADNEMPRQAYEQFAYLAKLPDGQLAGNGGIVDAAVLVGDYHAANQAIGVLREKYNRSAISQSAIMTFDSRRHGGMDFYYSHTSDYKGVDSNQFLLSADQHIGGSYSILASLGTNHLSDKDANESVTLRTSSLGLQYSGMKYDTRVLLDSYQGNGSFTGYRVYNNYYFDDHAVVNFDFEKVPLLDVQALNPANDELLGRIMTTNYSIGFRRQIGAKNTYTFNFTRGLYSDGNQVNSYAVRWDRVLLDQEKKSIDWFLFADRSDYKLQQINGIDTVYESPAIRQSYGTGFTERWLIPKGYWEATATFEWGRDRPEPHEFEPSLRLEYGHEFSPRHQLILGIEYGARTNRLLDSSRLGFGSRQYDIRYQATW